MARWDRMRNTARAREREHSREDCYAAHDTKETNGGGVLVDHTLDVEQLRLLQISGLAQVADDGSG